MTTIEDIYKNMDELLDEIEEEDVLEEVKERYEAYDKNMNMLLDSTDLESYLVKYEDINKEESAVLRCFNLDTTEELKTYIEDKEVNFDDLKVETAQASCEALKFIIYDSEEDDDY